MTADTDVEQSKMLVIGKDVLADGVVAVRLADPDGGRIPAWEAGSHIDIIIDESTVRQYSLCGDPADDTCLTIAVLREEDGRGGSRWVHDTLQVGDLVSIAGPRNNFTFEAADSYLFVAGGIGITPLLPMMRAAHDAGAQWRLLYGGRSRASMAFAAELSDRYEDRIDLRPQDEYGLLDLASALDSMPDGTHVYCCGPEPLLQAIEALCREREGWSCTSKDSQRRRFPSMPSTTPSRSNFTGPVRRSRSGPTRLCWMRFCGPVWTHRSHAVRERAARVRSRSWRGFPITATRSSRRTSKP